MNSAAANVGAAILLANIQDTQSMLTTLGVTLPVGNADAGSYFNDEVLAAVNYGVRNPVSPFIGQLALTVVADGECASLVRERVRDGFCRLDSEFLPTTRCSTGGKSVE